MGAVVSQPGDENELRGGFRAAFRPHAVKRRSRSVSESYSLDVRQQSISDRQAAQQFQKRVRRLSGGPSTSTTNQGRWRADSIGPSPSCISKVSVASSGRTRSNSFNSERALESSSSNSKHSNLRDANQSASTKARVYFDLRQSEPGTSNASKPKSNSPEHNSGCKVYDSRDGTSSAASKPVSKKKESPSSKHSTEKQKRVGDTLRDATNRERDTEGHVSTWKWFFVFSKKCEYK